ncbi:MAG: hypothetical protein AAF913_04355 [Pseudomonadota bacterium]
MHLAKEHTIFGILMVANPAQIAILAAGEASVYLHLRGIEEGVGSEVGEVIR